MTSPGIQSLPSGRILLANVYRYVLVEPNGSIVKERTFSRPLMNLNSIGDNFVARYMSYKDSHLFTKISILDHNLKPVKNLYVEKKRPPTDLSKVVNNYKIVDNILVVKCNKDKIFVARGEKGLYFEIYDGSGNLLSVVDKPYEKRPIKQKDKSFWIERFKNTPSMKKYWPQFKKIAKNLDDLFPKYYPAMQDFFVADDNVYIKTYQRRNDLEKYIILDLKGNILKTVFLPESLPHLFAFKNNRFYYLVENEEDEIWELHSVEI